MAMRYCLDKPALFRGKWLIRSRGARAGIIVNPDCLEGHYLRVFHPWRRVLLQRKHTFTAFPWSPVTRRYTSRRLRLRAPTTETPFNTLASASGVATPEDKFVVTPNSDTPYSFLWMDLRAEPMVISMPKIEKNRDYSAQLIDLYTFNFAYLGTRSYGNEGGRFLIAGPDWKGDTPEGITVVLRAQTRFAYMIFEHSCSMLGI